MAALNMQWAKVDEFNSDDDESSFGTGAQEGRHFPEQLIAKHDSIAEEYSDGLGNIDGLPSIQLSVELTRQATLHT